MRDFKFFRGYSGTLDMINNDIRATASFNDDTAEGHVFRRRLYHTDRNLYDRLNNPFNNNEMERYYYDHGLGRFETVTPTLNQEEVTRRINGGGTDIRLFQTTTVTTVNPKWWMKIKMFFQKLSLYWDQIWGIIVIATIVTVIFGLMISKVLNIW
jgi:hypothetical protein